MNFNTGNLTLHVFKMQLCLSLVFKYICKQLSQNSLKKLQLLYISVDKHSSKKLPD